VAPGSRAAQCSETTLVLPAVTQVIQFEDRSQQQTRYTTCFMCACRCGIKLTLEAGRVRFIQGNPDHPVNRGVLCAKGSAGIMKQYSPARLTKPLRRKPDAVRGSGEFEEIEWDEALDMLATRLRRIRGSDPKQLAFFCGRDQMQALTGLWAQQFGTPNWAAHGGFCSVNMAAAGMYSIGYSFWEFGAPDWDHAKYFLLWGVAEDHSSNPIKIGLDKLKKRGARIVSVNPVRTGYSAIADEWLPVRPGTDGLLAMAMAQVLLSRDLVDWEFLAHYTNAPWLIVQTPGIAGDGLVLRNEAGEPLVWDSIAGAAVPMGAGTGPALFGEYAAPDGRPVRPAFALTAERILSPRFAPATVSAQCGVPAANIERIALEMAHVAFRETVTLPIEWTDCHGRQHDHVTGRPVAMYAMRGVSAHSNGFQTCRTIHLLQMLLGALEGPGNFRARAPYPRPVPPAQLPENNAAVMDAPDTPLSRAPLGFPVRPEDLAIDRDGRPLRIDKAYSWEAPLAAHGLMHNVVANAVNGDPYTIDTLMLFMANMAWNSSMNVESARAQLAARHADGSYKIPFLVVADAFYSETVGYADLVLPDTTYLERYDAISLLDRPISEPDLVADSIRHPVLPLDRDVKPFQEVLIELASRLNFPAFTRPDGSRKFRDYPDFLVNYEKSPGVGFLAGWRGADGKTSLVGEPNPKQLEAYIGNQAFFAYELPERMRYMRFANRDYLQFAKESAFIPEALPIVLQIYSEPLQKFRLAGQGLYAGPQPADAQVAARIARYFDPLPDWYAPLEQDLTDADRYPLFALTQRPMAMYHSWDSQNAWLRQIVGGNFLYMNTATAAALGLADFDWAWVESNTGRLRCQIRSMQGVEPNTVWTWNAIAKQKGAWGLAANASESTSAFLLNTLIAERLPGSNLSNSDPITGQAAWFDLRVRVSKAAPGETGIFPQFSQLAPLPPAPATA
jgi:anaerobic selenocysteine-containing dehydrogenase